MSEELKKEVLEQEEELKEEKKEEEEKPEKKYTDEDVNEIVKKKMAKWKKDAEDEKAEAEKLAKMNEAEKFQYELDKLKEENAQLRKVQVRAEMNKTATTLLSDKGIDVNEGILNLVVTDDAETTKANIDSLENIINSALKKANLEKAKGKTPETLSETDHKLTKKELFAMGYDYVNKFKAENPEEYERIMKEN